MKLLHTQINSTWLKKLAVAMKLLHTQVNSTWFKKIGCSDETTSYTNKQHLIIKKRADLDVWLFTMFMSRGWYFLGIEPCSQQRFLGTGSGCGWPLPECGSMQSIASPWTKDGIASQQQQGRDKNGGVAAQGVRVGMFQWKIVRHPKCNMGDEWCKWPGQRQCCWRERFTAGKESDTQHKQSQIVLWDWLSGYYMRTTTYPAYKLLSVLTVAYYCPEKNIRYVTELIARFIVLHSVFNVFWDPSPVKTVSAIAIYTLESEILE